VLISLVEEMDRDAQDTKMDVIIPSVGIEYSKYPLRVKCRYASYQPVL
jgi:hypothetical protein